MERQAILDQPKPPTLWVVLDEAVLTGSSGARRSCMTSCCTCGRRADQYNITVQIVPAQIGAHAGLLGGFAIASFDNAPGTVYMESPDQGQTTELPSVVEEASLTFDTLRAARYPVEPSRDLIGKWLRSDGHTLDNAIWRKSSYSGSNGGNCVKWPCCPTQPCSARFEGPGRADLTFAATWRAFTTSVKRGELGLD